MDVLRAQAQHERNGQDGGFKEKGGLSHPEKKVSSYSFWYFFDLSFFFFREFSHVCKNIYVNMFLRKKKKNHENCHPLFFFFRIERKSYLKNIIIYFSHFRSYLSLILVEFTFDIRLFGAPRSWAQILTSFFWRSIVLAHHCAKKCLVITFFFLNKHPIQQWGRRFSKINIIRHCLDYCYVS